MRISLKPFSPLFLTAIAIICLVAWPGAAMPGSLSGKALSKPDFSTPVTLEELGAAYYLYSAPSIMEALMANNGANWQMMMNKIRTGDGDWIGQIANLVAPAAEGKATNDINTALAYALPKNPEAVLLTGWRYPLYNVCSLPFDEPDAFVTDYVDKALAAMHTVDKPYLKEIREHCAARLKKSLAQRRKV